MVESEAFLGSGFGYVYPLKPVTFRCLEQGVGAHDVCLDELLGTENRTIDVRFGCKMHNCVDLVLLQQPVDQGAVADISPDEKVAGGVWKSFQVFKAACIGERIQVNYAYPGLGPQYIVNKICTDEASASGD